MLLFGKGRLLLFGFPHKINNIFDRNLFIQDIFFNLLTTFCISILIQSNCIKIYNFSKNLLIDYAYVIKKLSIQDGKSVYTGRLLDFCKSSARDACSKQDAYSVRQSSPLTQTPFQNCTFGAKGEGMNVIEVPYSSVMQRGILLPTSIFVELKLDP